MGADLTLAILELPDTDEFDEKEWYLLLSAYLNTMPKDIVENIMLEHAPWFDTIEEAYSHLRTAIEECTLGYDTRDKGVFRINNRWALITGGMTWGDSPTDSYDEVNMVSMLVNHEQ